MIDSHCHLADVKFADDLPQVIARAKEAGISTMITIGDSLEESARCIKIAEEFEGIFCTVGVHPHVSNQWTADSEQSLRALVASSPKVRAIGEIGLDYHYDFSPRDVQREVFRSQLKIAHSLDLPVVVHCREAVEDVWNIVQDHKPRKLVLHCCTETWRGVQRFVEQGYLLSFTGIATYPNADDIRETIRRCPIGQMMIETDAPYLAPVPHRGKRNEPAFVTEVTKIIAEIKGIPVGEVESQTTKNAVEFFGLRL